MRRRPAYRCSFMSHARISVAAAILALALPSCANVSPEEIAASEQALTVCHTTVVEGIDVASGPTKKARSFRKKK